MVENNKRIHEGTLVDIEKLNQIDEENIKKKVRGVKKIETMYVRAINTDQML